MTARARRFCVLLLVVAEAVFLPGARAQQPAAAAGATVPLSLKQAVQLALKQNPQREIAKILILESQRNSQIARAALLPQAALEADGSYNQYNLNSVEKNPPVRAAGPFHYIEAGPAFSQTILNLPLIRGYQAGREGVKQAHADELTTRETVVDAVVNQYLLILRARALRDAAEARVALAQRLYDQATELEKTGVGLKIDAVRANVELQNERQTLIDADTETRTTAYGLADLLDLPKNQDVEATDHLDFFELPEMDKDAMVNQALTARPEMASIHSQLRISRLNASSAKEERIPELGFSGFWFYQGQHFDDGIPAYRYEVSMLVPIFTGGRIHAEIERAKLEEQRIEENQRQLEAQIVDQVKTSLDQLTAARNAVEVANLGYQLAQEEVAQAERRFNAGVTTNIEVITAQDELARASDNQIAALYRFNMSRADLARATGTIETMYSK